MSNDLDNLYDLAAKIRNAEPGFHSTRTLASVALDLCFGILEHLRSRPAPPPSPSEENAPDCIDCGKPAGGHPRCSACLLKRSSLGDPSEPDDAELDIACRELKKIGFGEENGGEASDEELRESVWILRDKETGALVNAVTRTREEADLACPTGFKPTRWVPVEALAKASADAATIAGLRTMLTVKTDELRICRQEFLKRDAALRDKLRELRQQIEAHGNADFCASLARELEGIVAPRPEPGGVK